MLEKQRRVVIFGESISPHHCAGIDFSLWNRYWVSRQDVLVQKNMDSKEAVSEDLTLFQSHQMHGLAKAEMVWATFSVCYLAEELAWQAKTAGEGHGIPKQPYQL